jgi:DNA-directed RNA polymerase subunit RPC12/RpoP
MPEAVEKKIRQYPCKGCGASLEFKPDAASLQCPYCGFKEDIPQTEQQIKEYAYNAHLAKKSARGYGQEKRVAVCPRCAAQTVVDPQVEATRCVYCDTPMTMKESADLADLIQPEAVLPFKVEKPDAERKFQDWIRGLWFAPTALTKLKALEKMTGLYRPYWTFDSHTANAWSGERGDHYYVTVGTGKDQRREQRTRWTSVSGSFRRFFDDVLIDAGRGLSWNTDFDLKALVTYDPRVLSGWEAETYTLPLDGGWKKAKEHIDGALYSDACSRVGGDTHRNVRVNTAYSGITYKHILLPMYMASYRYRDKAFQFQVNGQTGDVDGQRPYSFWKIFLLVVGILAAIGAVVLIVGNS